MVITPDCEGGALFSAGCAIVACIGLMQYLRGELPRLPNTHRERGKTEHTKQM